MTDPELLVPTLQIIMKHSIINICYIYFKNYQRDTWQADTHTVNAENKECKMLKESKKPNQPG